MINTSFKKENHHGKVKIISDPTKEKKEKRICSLMSSFDSKNNNCYDTLITNEINHQSRIITEFSHLQQTPAVKEKSILKLKEFKKNGIKLVNTDLFKKIIKDKLKGKPAISNLSINNNVNNCSTTKPEQRLTNEKKLSGGNISKHNFVEKNKNNSIINIIENIKDCKILNINTNGKLQTIKTLGQQANLKSKMVSENTNKPSQNSSSKHKGNSPSKKQNKEEKSKSTKEKIININHNINHNINLNINNINNNSKSTNISPNLGVEQSDKNNHSISIKKNIFTRENIGDEDCSNAIINVGNHGMEDQIESAFMKNINAHKLFNDNNFNNFNIFNDLSNQLKMKNIRKSSHGGEDNKSLPPKIDDQRHIIPNIARNNNFLIKSNSASHSRSNSKKESGDMISIDESLFTNLSRKCKLNKLIQQRRIPPRNCRRTITI